MEIRFLLENGQLTEKSEQLQELLQIYSGVRTVS